MTIKTVEVEQIICDQMHRRDVSGVRWWIKDATGRQYTLDICDHHLAKLGIQSIETPPARRAAPKRRVKARARRSPKRRLKRAA